MTTTFRASGVAGLLTILDAFKAANPTLVRRTFPTQPPSYNTDLPAMFVSGWTEAVGHDMQTRTRTANAAVTLVDRLTDNVETMAKFNSTVDLFMDHLTSFPHIFTGTIWDRVVITDAVLEEGAAKFMSVTFTITNLSIQEGRP